MLASTASSKPRFLRRTSLEADEYRTNFRQIDCDILSCLISEEARRVSHSMAHVYLALVNAPAGVFEREGVLRFTGADREGKGRLTAWKQLRRLTGVANSTLSKCVDWLSANGLIGYCAYPNGVGIRIFLNRAAKSVAKRSASRTINVVRTPSVSAPAPKSGVAFKEIISRKNLEGVISDAPGGAKTPLPPDTPNETIARAVNDISSIITATCSREAALTREWLEKAGIPKAVRVAQHEVFSVLRLNRNRGLSAKKGNSGVGLANATAKTVSTNDLVHTWIEFAKNVRGRDLGDLLTDYVVQGELSEEEAKGILQAAALES